VQAGSKVFASTVEVQSNFHELERVYSPPRSLAFLFRYKQFKSQREDIFSASIIILSLILDCDMIRIAR
jgi:hypothetical protein